ncbi:SDR family NAD(P)-dependent oxidoreductase [Methylocucumis oryzae]|uniref:SDR family NAD(P)-dependent oxidoreductase n=1 Tax=Methylocucumis oryzae TaxID=1632867 RepID=UPI000698E72E|nr:SDR family NAD(P)-dependent oxidoreductase [Methylocucumis oryzae]
MARLSKTLFFEYQTLAELTDYLLSQHRARFQTLLNTPPSLPALKPVDKTQAVSTLPQPAPIPVNTPHSGCLDIAIIGLAGRYPKALDVNEYWQNLRNGRNCISEIPPERWAWQQFYNADRSQHHGHYSKWGGFIDGVDQFDALFFNISPREAEAIDPQERLFLQHAWLALEDAGYTPSDLQQLVNTLQPELPAQVGVYAGVMYSEYQLLSINQPDTVASASYASIANRVSYFLNLHGPSLTVDTMCSSSLTAIHLACQDLAQGRTDLAIAGGVNVSVHPNKYSMLSRGQFISSLGQCQSFGVGGDGYIPGEGVGVVVLKRLAEAERDGDNIYGVIKGSALNHGGKTNGYSVPNPKAQTAVIRQAMRQAHVKADAISYIEAHGTGTQLGDPIEITGLTKAFQQDGVTGSCRIGSAKSNIGHCESAAGIAGLTKVLLQLKHHEIAPSLHAETLNPNIDFAATPFIVNQQLTAWEKPVVNGETLTRIAGLSSFGAGGANAHIIIAEYDSPTVTSEPVATPQLIVLSANTEAQRTAYAQSLLAWLDNNANNTALTLANLAYSLSTGRMAMSKRLAIIAEDLTGLRQQLLDFLAQPEQAQPIQGIYVGIDDDIETVAHEQVSTWFNSHELALLADYWRQGGVIAWRELYSGKRLTRLNVPTYPFANERHWLSVANTTPDSTPMLSEHGLLLLTPIWQATALNESSPVQHYAARLLVTVGIAEFADSIELKIDSTDLVTSYQQTVVALSSQLQNLLKHNPNGQLLCQVLIPGLGYADSLQIFAGLAGLLATVSQENPRLTTQLIALEQQAKAHDLVSLLAQHSNSGFIRCQNNQFLRQTWQEAALIPNTTPLWRQGGVYLITGGAGGLGLIIAEAIAKQCPNLVLLLTGRRSLDHDDACFKSLADLGTHFEYHALDVADEPAVSAFIAEIKQRYQTINGIIHAAGITHDQAFITKSEQTLLAVLAPKVQGLVNLDLATRGLDLDWLVLFSSVAAFGNPGQADYAAANGFMDAYCQYRNQLSQDASLASEQKPHGITLTINWPLWADGGMSVPETVKRQMWTSAGITPLSTELGLRAFNQIVASALTQTLVLAGDLTKLRAGLVTPTPKPVSPAPIKPSTETLESQVVSYLKALLSELLKLPAHRIDEHSPLESYGVNSVVALSLTNELENHLGSLPKTLFFEYPSLAQVSAYLASTYRQALHDGLGLTDYTEDKSTIATPTEPKPLATEQTNADIAIIGLGGHLPNADTLEQFWQHLLNGESSITEIPASRWDWQVLADTAHTRCHWGSFINNVAAFDPLFFNITPKDAPYIDPMERLFLETVWQVLERSGQLGERLSQCYQQQVGVFVGAMYQHYRDWLADSEQPSSLLSSFSAIANRVSYFFNFQGPSVAVDTMCSSTGIALHMACTSLLNGEIKLAIVGGVNLSLHPNKYQGLNQAQLAASRADSISFADGDGYIPAEAVGAIVLKPLTAAIAEGDEILAVIKATAVNHAGQGSGFATPNPAAQAELIQACLDKAQVSANTISYVEAAANGMALADALEFSALRKVFANTTTPCALGSVKALIGHAEAASGFTQLAKTVLQLQHQHITPIPEPTRTNPAIALTDTCFYWPRQSSPWPSNGTEPRRVLINSFGAGGSNACILVEEFIKPEHIIANDDTPALCLFSAKTQAQLSAIIQQFIAYLQKTKVNLADLAYTLQAARQHMTLRLAIIASNQDDLLAQLHAYLSGQTEALFIGDMHNDTTAIKQNIAVDDGLERLAQAFQQQDWSTLAYYWVNGVALPWLSYYRAEPRGLLTSLPAYPLSTECYWLTLPPPINELSTNNTPALHPRFCLPNCKEVQSAFPRKAWER